MVDGVESLYIGAELQANLKWVQIVTLMQINNERIIRYSK